MESSEKKVFEASKGFDFVMDLLSEKLHHELKIDYQTLLPIMREVREEFFLKTNGKFYFVKDRLIYGDRWTRVPRASLVWKFLFTICNSTFQRLTREKLVQIIYGESLASASMRKKASLLNSLSKLASRARRIVQEDLDDGQWQWIIYEVETDEYVLMKPVLKVISFSYKKEQYALKAK